MTPQITPTQKTPKLATAQRRKHAHLTETAFSHHKSTKQPSHVRTTAPLKHISDLQKNDCKTRYKNCTASFRHTKHRNSIELSKHIWTLKENNMDHFISWRILSSRSPFNSASKRCNLCLKEKLPIICQLELSSLNKGNELVSACRHRNKALLRNNWTKHWNLPPRLLCKFVKYINDGTNILSNTIPWWESNHETGLQGWKYSLFFSVSQYILRSTSTYRAL